MLEFLFNPLLVFEPVLAVTVFAIIVLIMINLCYRFLINQQEAKQIKERTKELNRQMKEEQKHGNTQKVSELMKELMVENNKLMGKTMKPMLASFVIIILFFPWLHANYGDQTITMENNMANLTIAEEMYIAQVDGDKVDIIKNSATVASFSASASEKDRRFALEDDNYVISYEQEGGFIFTHPDQIKLAKVVAFLPNGINLPLFGNEFGWLGWYLMVSIPFVMLIRKILKISA